MERLPNVGDKIPIDLFYVSKTNMRADDPFPQNEEDEALIRHFAPVRARVVQPFKARPEDKEGHWAHGMDPSLAVGYGVVVGRRRFLAMKMAGRLKEFTVGADVLIEEITDEEAMDASLKENLEEFRRAPDPITRADAINRFLSRLPTGLRGLARYWGMPHSTLSEYLKILDLNPAMQAVVKKRIVSFRDGLATARLRLGDEMQTRLAEVAETQGVGAFKRELARLMAGKGKKGIPSGVYIVVRSTFDKRSRDDLRCYKTLEKLAEKEGMKVADYTKKIVVDHIVNQKRWSIAEFATKLPVYELPVYDLCK